MIAFLWGLLLGALFMEIVLAAILFGDDIKLAISRFVVDRKAEQAKRAHDATTTGVRLKMAAIDREAFERIASAKRKHNEGR